MQEHIVRRGDVFTLGSRDNKIRLSLEGATAVLLDKRQMFSVMGQAESESEDDDVLWGCEKEHTSDEDCTCLADMEDSSCSEYKDEEFPQVSQQELDLLRMSRMNDALDESRGLTQDLKVLNSTVYPDDVPDCRLKNYGSDDEFEDEDEEQDGKVDLHTENHENGCLGGNESQEFQTVKQPSQNTKVAAEKNTADEQEDAVEVISVKKVATPVDSLETVGVPVASGIVHEMTPWIQISGLTKRMVTNFNKSKDLESDLSGSDLSDADFSAEESDSDSGKLVVSSKSLKRKRDDDPITRAESSKIRRVSSFLLTLGAGAVIGSIGTIVGLAASAD
jgi:hypothetical protein